MGDGEEGGDEGEKGRSRIAGNFREAEIAYAQYKNTSAGLCAKNAGEAYARGGAYLRDTTVHAVCHISMREIIGVWSDVVTLS